MCQLVASFKRALFAAFFVLASHHPHTFSLPTDQADTCTKTNMLLHPFLALISALLPRVRSSPIARQAHVFKRIDGLAPLGGLHDDDKIEDHYIVLFDSNHTLDDHYAHIGRNLSQDEHFVKLRHGYGASVPDASLLARIRADAGVLAVETNRVISIPDYVRTPTNESMPEVPEGPSSRSTIKRGTKTYETRKNYAAPWGLQMISAGGKLKSPPKDFGTYEYLANAGEGVWVYVLDSG